MRPGSQTGLRAAWRERLIGGLKVSEAIADAPLAPLTTLRIGGRGDLLITAESEADLIRVLNPVRDEGTPLTVLGKGSNVLIPDAGLRGIVLRLGRAFSGFEVDGEGQSVQAGAGLANATFVERARSAGLGGMEFLVTIPGTIGGAIAMNAGAFQSETAAHLLAVRSIDLMRDPLAAETQPAAAFPFAYRSSPLRAQDRRLVLEGQFRMEPTADAEIQARKERHMRYRRDTQPREYPNCGSVFKNPPGTFAAKLIEEAGLKGHRLGGAQISEKHANFIVNRGGATYSDVLSLIDLIRRTVYDRYQIRLEPEVQILGASEAL
jgi:UDP-N-acetylmuramate dehydrogenase